MTTILFIGLGSIGTRHLMNVNAILQERGAFKNLKDPAAAPEFVALRKSQRPKQENVQGVRITNVNSIDEAFAHNPSMAFICNPTIFHIEAALQAAKHNCNLFIEKPLSHSLDHLEELEQVVNDNRLVAMVGCVLRFKGVVQKVKELLQKKAIGKAYHFSASVGQYLPDWQPGRDHRDSYRAKSAMGGGAVLELIHEIDYVQYLFGPYAAIAGITGQQASLGIDAEDTAVIACNAGGVLGTISLDFLQRIPHRDLKIVGEQGTLFADLNTSTIVIERPAREKEIIQIKEDRNQMYLDEVRHFLDCIQYGKAPLIGLHEGISALKAALQAKQGLGAVQAPPAAPQVAPTSGQPAGGGMA